MIKFKFFLLLTGVLYFPQHMHSQPAFDIEGHRGCRGLYPENTVVAFIEAIKLGVNTLEMDVVVSKDGQLVVSHDPYLNPSICMFPEGQPSEQDAKKTARIYNMTYEEIKRYDCGTMPNEEFPHQRKTWAPKPLLNEVIDTVENYIRLHRLPAVQYNIETKSTPAGDDLDHPEPVVFAKLLYDLVKQKGILDKCIIQSFDPRTLQQIRKADGKVKLALLVFNADGFEGNIKRLGFSPYIYSPNFVLVNKKLVEKCRKKDIKLIPWTVNEEKKMLHLKEMGVDGLITDYPDRAIRVLRK